MICTELEALPKLIITSTAVDRVVGWLCWPNTAHGGGVEYEIVWFNAPVMVIRPLRTEAGTGEAETWADGETGA